MEMFLISVCSGILKILFGCFLFKASVFPKIFFFISYKMLQTGSHITLHDDWQLPILHSFFRENIKIHQEGKPRRDKALEKKSAEGVLGTLTSIREEHKCPVENMHIDKNGNWYILQNAVTEASRCAINSDSATDGWAATQSLCGSGSKTWEEGWLDCTRLQAKTNEKVWFLEPETSFVCFSLWISLWVYGGPSIIHIQYRWLWRK